MRHPARQEAGQPSRDGAAAGRLRPPFRVEQVDPLGTQLGDERLEQPQDVVVRTRLEHDADGGTSTRAGSQQTGRTRATTPRRLWWPPGDRRVAIGASRGQLEGHTAMSGADGAGATLRLVLAEDSYLVREGIKLLVGLEQDLELVADCGDLPSLLAAVDEHLPDVVLTDIRMPPTNTDEGIRAAETLRDTHPQIGVLVLSQYVEPGWALHLLERGSQGRGYLLKERVGDLAELTRAIRTVADGGSVIDPKVVDTLVEARMRRQRSLLDRLTPRELEVLSEIAQGRNNAGIAASLVLSERAVEKHINSIFSKLDLATADDHLHRRVRAVLLYLAEHELPRSSA